MSSTTLSTLHIQFFQSSQLYKADCPHYTEEKTEIKRELLSQSCITNKDYATEFEPRQFASRTPDKPTTNHYATTQKP